MTTETELIEALCEEFQNIDPAALSGASILKDELGLSSLDVVIVRAKIQDSFGVILTDEDVISSATLNELVNRINAGQ